jgi:type I restriction enzyme S subunit
MVVVIGATAGRAALLRRNGSCNQQITSFELQTQSVEPSFVAYQFKRAESWLKAIASSATLPIIDSAELARAPIALPPVSEQKAILLGLEKALQPLHAAVSRAELQIDLIREYRTRLIADVVTGKLDVRGVPLPDSEPDDGADPDDWDQLEMFDHLDVQEANDAED